MAIKFVQNAYNAGSFFGGPRTITCNPTELGHLIIIVAAGNSGYGGTASTITDNGGNVYTLVQPITSEGTAGTMCGTWWSICTKPATVISSAACQQLAMWEYSGVRQVSPIDAFGNTISSPTGPSIVTTNAGDLVFASSAIEVSFGGGSSMNAPYGTDPHTIQISNQEWLMGGANFPGVAGSQPGQTYSAWNWGTNQMVAFFPDVINPPTEVEETTQVKNILPVANGGTGTSTPSLIAGTEISSITGTWPNQTINATNQVAGANTQIQFNNSGAFGASANLTWDSTSSQPTLKINSNGVSGAVPSLDITDTIGDGAAQIHLFSDNDTEINFWNTAHTSQSGAVYFDQAQGYITNKGFFELHTDDQGANHLWTFGADGSLTTPGVITSGSSLGYGALQGSGPSNNGELDLTNDSTYNSYIILTGNVTNPSAYPIEIWSGGSNAHPFCGIMMFSNYLGVSNLTGSTGQSSPIVLDTVNGIYTTASLPISSGGNLSSSGAVAEKLSTVTTTYTADDEAVILCDATSGAFTVTLPAAASVPNRRYAIKKIDATANGVTVQGNGAETIDGSNTQTMITQWESLTVVCNGTSWFLI